MYVEGDLPVLTTGGNGGGNGPFGNMDSWVLIILFALIFGWGRNGNNEGQSSGGVMDAYVLNSDFATLQRQLDSGFDRIGNRIENVNNGLCNGFYTQAQLVNGIQSQISSEFRTVDSAICNLGYNMQDCCCQIKGAISDAKYAAAMNTRDLIENQNANYRALHDEIVANRIEDKNAQISAQQNEINALRLKASQEAQNAYLLSELKACPKPAFVVQPSQPVTFPTNCCGTASYANFGNNGCGCGV